MRAYDALLHLYPSSFRREYGADLRALFARRRRDAPGPAAIVALWTAEILDVLANAAAAHWDLIRQDLRYTARTLARSPGFAITAIAVTALGVGANTAAFSVADFVLIRPLPFAEPERLVRLWEHPRGGGTIELSPPNYLDWKATSRSFQAMGAYHGTSMNLVGQGEPERLTGTAVTADLLPLLGVRPSLGRLFTAAEERDGADGTVVLSSALWHRAFGGDSAVIGRRLLLDGVPRVVIGVMPDDFHFPSREVALWTPMPLREQLDDDRVNNWLDVVARLKREVSLGQARADLAVVTAQLERRYPRENELIGATVIALREQVSQRSRMLLLALCGAAMCVLLIACANLANLLIARSLARRRELDVRAALGAGRERLVRQLVTESLTIAGIGGALGVAVAVVSVPLLARLVPATLPIAQSPAVDLRVLLFAALVTALTGIGFGVMPAIRASGTSDLSALREGARAGGGRRARLRSALVIGEVMASVVLLVSSGLLLRALSRINDTDPGFRAESVLTLRTALQVPPYDSLARRERFYSQVLTGVRALPGVRSAAYISFLPMVMGGGIWGVAMPGQEPTHAPGNSASLRFTTPGFFESLGIPLRRGRDVEDADDNARPLVAVVSESFARRYWPGEDALDKRFAFANEQRTVVGVVGDIRVRGLEQVSEPQVYLPYRQRGTQSPFYFPKDLVIRSSVPPTSLAGAVRRLVHEADPLQPVSNVQTMAAIVAEQTATRVVQVRVLGAFALVAFLLAAVGIHGLLSYTVSERSHEFGVRMALGAPRGVIVGMVMRHGAVLAVSGVVPGIIVAYGAARVMQALLAGVTPGDATTFLAAAALCTVMTLAGSLLPVLRAVRVPPASVFRS